ncbi:hypothetical protein ACOMHN_009467 [Nucella lapillus]
MTTEVTTPPPKSTHSHPAHGGGHGSDPTTAAPTDASDAFLFPGCLPFNCSQDCGLNGYMVDANNCLLCQCQE